MRTDGESEEAAERRTAERIAAAFPPARVPDDVESRVLAALRPGIPQRTRRLHAARLSVAVVAALAVVALSFALTRHAASPPSVKEAAGSLDASATVPRTVLVPSGHAGAMDATSFENVGAASGAVGFRVLEPAYLRGRSRVGIRVPSNGGRVGAGSVVELDYGDFQMSQWPAESDRAAQEEVRNLAAVGGGLEPGSAVFVDVNGHAGYADGTSGDHRRGSETTGGAGIWWSDDHFVYRLASEALSPRDLLAVARSVPGR